MPQSALKHQLTSATRGTNNTLDNGKIMINLKPTAVVYNANTSMGMMPSVF